MLSDITLYDYPLSSASYRVRIACHLKQISYGKKNISLLDGDQRHDEFLALNPQGYVPVLTATAADGQPIKLSQSLVIMEYLNKIYPSPDLMMADPLKQAENLQIAYMVAMDIHPICNLGVVTHVVDLLEGESKDKIAWMQHWIPKGLQAIEAHLQAQKTQHLFCMGDEPKLADICLRPQIYNADRWRVDMTQFPRLSEIKAACDEHPAFQAAHPDQQDS